MTHQDFIDQINGFNGFENQTFDFDIILLSGDIENNYNLSFKNCIFKNSVRLERINNPDLTLVFHDCSFDSEVNIVNCVFNILNFSRVIKILSIDISGRINSLYINSHNDLKGLIAIENCLILNRLDCSNLHISEGQLSINLKNTIDDNNYFDSYFNNSTLDKVNFSNCYLGNECYIQDLQIINTAFFQCDFKKVYFDRSDFGNDTFFMDCKFHSYSGFEECGNLKKTNIVFRSCLFKSFPHFNKSKFNHIEIKHTTFQRKASFDDMETNTITLYQVSFHEEAYFNEIRINNLENSDRTTLRLIKRELVNTHNQIDYLRFKAYELKAYKKETDKDKLNWKDSLILYFTESSNNYGLDWTRGIGFTFQWSFFLYILYIISYASMVNQASSLPDINSFFTNYLKFTNPLSFLNPPLEDSENYFLPLIILLMGKIFVAFGIYQTVQAFRKFGINGE